MKDHILKTADTYTYVHTHSYITHAGKITELRYHSKQLFFFFNH